MAVFKCKMCGGTLEINNNETVVTCEYCGTKQTLPKLDDDRKANLYDRANHFRRNNEFDKAMGIYEQILNEDSTDAEAYWSLVLCRYGIEYVEDPSTRKRLPTINRAQFTSVFDDEDYKSALQYADGYQKDVYEQEAAAINEIQKGILAISSQEEPFDVFICYKESDKNGRRTPDSVLATELYHELTREGFKVFFSRITLEDKLGTAYEPYIFAALNSSKVMVVLGTKPEFFNAVWVKNEWSRYLALIKNGARKMLIPAYKDMDPYDLPDEFSHLQAQDMSKLGFMQDLIRGVKKIVENNTYKHTIQETGISNEVSGNVIALIKRGYMALEDSEWDKADDFFEQALNQDAELAEAYLGKLMAELRVKVRDELKNSAEPFDSNANYKKVLRFGDSRLKNELAGYIEFINTRIENARLEEIYNKAKNAMAQNTTEIGYKGAAQLFESIADYKDASILAKKCYEKAEIARKDGILNKAKNEMNGEIASYYEYAIKLLESISGWKNADELIIECKNKIEELKAKAEAERIERERKAEIARIDAEKRAKRNKKIAIISTIVACVAIAFVVVLNTVIIPYVDYNNAVSLMKDGKYTEALSIFYGLNGYKDSAEKFRLLIPNETISTGLLHTVGLKSDGTVVATGSNDDGQCDVSNWTDIVSVSAGYYHTIGLKSDGTVVATGRNKNGQCDVSDWTDIVSVSAGSYQTIGLKSDGTVVATGWNDEGQCDVSDWTDIVSVTAGSNHTVGVKSDGTVVATGLNDEGECDVSDWTDIVAVSAGFFHTLGVKSDGTVVATGLNYYGVCDVSDWTDIVSVSAGETHTVGLKSDGTVVATGSNRNGQCAVSNWTDIVSVSAGETHTLGVKSDGTVVATNESVQSGVESWKITTSQRQIENKGKK